jgi:ATP-dependent Clp protease, protease subunit
MSAARGQATDIQIQAKEVLTNRGTMLDILSRNTGQDREKIHKDMDRLFYMTPQQAVEYGVIDKVFETKEELAKSPLPAGVL